MEFFQEGDKTNPTSVDEIKDLKNQIADLSAKIDRIFANYILIKQNNDNAHPQRKKSEKMI